MYEQHGSSLHSLCEPALGRWEEGPAASSRPGGGEFTLSGEVPRRGLEFRLKSEEEEGAGQESGEGSGGGREDGGWKLLQ